MLIYIVLKPKTQHCTVAYLEFDKRFITDQPIKGEDMNESEIILRWMHRFKSVCLGQDGRKNEKSEALKRYFHRKYEIRQHLNYYDKRDYRDNPG